MRILLPAALFGAALTLVAFAPAQALPGAWRQAIAERHDGGLVEEARSRRKRLVKRHHRTYYVPYACARPYKYYYWQFWPPVCYPL